MKGKNSMKNEISKENAPEFTTLRPAADVEDTATGVIISFEMPGVKSSDIDIEAGNGMLKIEGKSSLCRRGVPVMFKRSFYISDAVDVDKISASAKDGVVTLNLPKVENAVPKKIKVN